MYETVSQWLAREKNFTPYGSLRETQNMFADPNFQHAAQGMVDLIVETLPQDIYRFRTVFPKEFGEAAVQYPERCLEYRYFVQVNSLKKDSEVTEIFIVGEM